MMHLILITFSNLQAQALLLTIFSFIINIIVAYCFNINGELYINNLVLSARPPTYYYRYYYE